MDQGKDFRSSVCDGPCIWPEGSDYPHRLQVQIILLCVKVRVLQGRAALISSELIQDWLCGRGGPQGADNIDE